MQLDSLAHLYSSKTDEELLLLAADPSSLVKEAGPILAEEMRRRNLAVEPSATALEYRIPNPWNSTVGKVFRAVGAFLLNLVVAIFGTAIIESSISSQIGHAHSLSAIEARVWLLSLTIAALLGFVFIRRWPTKTAMWVWIPPVMFFALGALAYMGRNRSFWEHFFAPDCTDSAASCRDFMIFTIPAARSVVYSVAAYVSLRFQSGSHKNEVPRT